MTKSEDIIELDQPGANTSAPETEQLDGRLTVEDIEVAVARDRRQKLRVVPDPILSAVRVSVVIPSLNEEDNLAYVFERMPREVHEVVLVDGHSTDHTIEVARRLPPGLQRARAERLVYHRRDHRQAEAGKP